jgi:hypothetical protein
MCSRYISPVEFDGQPPLDLFRHTYATFRLSEGVDVYFLSNQWILSVQMIEDHYGHINPVKNAERILYCSGRGDEVYPRITPER